jgi:RND family efflux transporter MFP subunit
MLLSGPILARPILALAAGTADQTPAAARIPCLIEPHRLIKLATPVPGVLDQVLVDRGDKVTKGMLVARLESAVEEAELAAAKVKSEDDSTVQQKQARKDYTEAKRARMEQLRSSSQYVARGTYEEAESDATQARAELLQAKTALKLARIDFQQSMAKLDQRTIHSPIDGMVTERSLSPGEYAYDQASVLTIAELDPLNVEAFLPIGQYGTLKLGSRMRVRPEAPIGGSYIATVAVIDRVLDSRSGTFGVRLLLADPEHLLPAGIRCELAGTEPE